MYQDIESLQDSDNLWEELYEMARQSLYDDQNDLPTGIRKLAPFVEMDMKVYNAGIQGYFSQCEADGCLNQSFDRVCDSLTEFGALSTVQLLRKAQAIWDRESTSGSGKDSWDLLAELFQPINSSYFSLAEDRGTEIASYALLHPDQFVHKTPRN